MICLRQLKFAEIENWESLLQEMFADFEITNKAMSEYIKKFLWIFLEIYIDNSEKHT